ncbi:MAG TPA: SRPBCC domain-containing protein [Devosia sp.]|nr:SRPBCC domain-containing protein [Devosia sp.]
MTGAAPAVQTRTLVVEREIAAPPARLWRALTQPHLLEEWLMKTDFQPVPGRRFTLRRQPAPGVDVVVSCQVLEVEPERTLSYTWDAFDLESVVTFTLTPTPSGTLLRLEQSGFRPEQKAAYKGARASWPHFLAALDELIRRTD